MAKPATSKEAERLLEQSKKAEEAKRASQEKKGKDFVNYGQGVIPERAWKNLPGKEKSNGPK